MYSLFFVNCNGELGESLVTMDGRAELYNTNDDGTTKNYLSAGQTHLPFLFFFFSFIYLCFLGFWILACFKNQRCFHRVHLIMGGLLVMNSVQIICAAADLYYVKVTGSPHGLDFLFYTFHLIRTVLLATVIVLILTGWGFWKQFLEGKDKLVLIIVIILDVWGNVYSILAWEAVGASKMDWSQDAVGIGSVCCFAILVPMAWSIMSLKDDHDDLNAFLNVMRLCLFGPVVLVYMIFKTVVVPVLFIPFPWMNYWVEEISIFVLCIVMFFLFSPFPEEDDDEKAVQLA